MAVPAWAASNVFVTDVSPEGGAKSVAADSNITAQFSKAMRASTIKGTTFYLKKQGSSTAIPATVSYSGTSKTATLNPESNLEAGATYTATVKGGRRGVKASDGGRLGGTRDSTATFANRKVTWSFTVANAIEATPSSLDFGGFAYCPTDPSPDQNVTLKNNGTNATTISPSISGPDASSFSVPTDSISLASNETVTVAVTFTPSGAWGQRTGSLDLKDVSDNTVLTVPLKAAVKCPIEG
jgi:hypothetical protein